MNDLMKGSWMKSFCFMAAVLSILAYEEIDAKMKEHNAELSPNEKSACAMIYDRRHTFRSLK